MSSICPVCNALENWNVACPQCGSPLSDQGRILDCYGPYSAYRPIDDLKLTNGLNDLTTSLCYHVGNCRVCNKNYEAPIQEWITS